jgi:hypothetical protein
MKHPTGKPEEPFKIGDLSEQVRLGGGGKESHQMMDETGHEEQSRKYLGLQEVTSNLVTLHTLQGPASSN